MIAFFGTENALFETVGTDRDVFDDALGLTSETVQERRGKLGALRTNREKLLFLMIFMRKGIDVIELLVVNFIKTREHIVERAKKIAQLFYSNLVGGTVRFFGETVPEAPDAALIVDCTVCQIRRPKKPFDEAKVYFSGKHFVYGLKKEVCVNVRTGTAAIISKAHPSSVHDIVILRNHAAGINDLLSGKALLADLGYRGANRDVPTLLACDEQEPRLRARRVLIECFFGRLKLLWTVFSVKWRLGEECFDVFFDIACALTNLDILHRPLRGSDALFNEAVMKNILVEQMRKVERQRRANAAYKERRMARLSGEGPYEPFMN